MHILTEPVKGYRRVCHRHSIGNAVKIFLLPVCQNVTIPQKMMPAVQVCQNLADLYLRCLKRILLHIGKTQADHRIGSLQLSVWIRTIRRLFVPYTHLFKQIAPSRIINRKKLLDHTHIQCFSKTPWAGDQCHAVKILPPFTDKTCFVNIETIIFNEFIVTLMTDSDYSRHMTHLLSL